MFRESLIDKMLGGVKKLIPKSVFDFFAPIYHAALAYAGAVLYGFPSRSMKVIGVTGTKGKSTVTYLISKILEANGDGVAAIGSLGYKIKNKEWPNTLKMTMPGRFKLQKFLYEAKRAGCKYVVLEVTSEGIKQRRHLGIKFDCAVFTNLHKEHLESHGSFENYYKAKQELFRLTPNIHVVNADDPNIELFSKFPSRQTIFYGVKGGDIRAVDLSVKRDKSSFNVFGTDFHINFGGEFNILNALAALAVAAMYKVDLPNAKPILESIKSIPGRMEFIQLEPFNVVVDYAHTSESLIRVYQTLGNSKLDRDSRLHTGTFSEQTLNSKQTQNDKTQNSKPRLICVLGAAGGGRDKWKRPEFGRIAAEYCDEIILTDEDPYDENPDEILNQIESGFSSQTLNSKLETLNYTKILDRREAIKIALTLAKEGDTVIVTGKGSETSMAVAGGKKIPWSDKDIVRELLNSPKN